MNTPNTSTDLQAHRLAPFHRSTRTALSLNTDAVTGQHVQVLNTSRLELCWIAGELRIDCRVSQVVMDANRAQRPVWRARGAL
jgi:hypothetical protein